MTVNHKEALETADNLLDDVRYPHRDITAPIYAADLLRAYLEARAADGSVTALRLLADFGDTP